MFSFRFYIEECNNVHVQITLCLTILTESVPAVRDEKLEPMANPPEVFTYMYRYLIHSYVFI